MFNKSCPLIKVTIRNTRLKTDYQATSQPHILHRLEFDLPKNTDTSLQKNPIKPEKPTGSDFFQKKTRVVSNVVVHWLYDFIAFVRDSTTHEQYGYFVPLVLRMLLSA